MGLGFFAGSLASVVNIPYDVAKSRIQGPQPVPGQIKYYGAHKAIFTIYKGRRVSGICAGSARANYQV